LRTLGDAYRHVSETDGRVTARLSPAAGRALLAVATGAVLASLVLGFAWWRSAGGSVDLDRLTAEQRRGLAVELLAGSPGKLVPAWFEPRIGYTLAPRTTVEAWGDRFPVNDLGYRAPPSAKPAGTFRVLFVGDSWTFGLGLPAEQAFPAVVEDLARQAGAAGGRVEAWSLALPGYNTEQQLAALWFFFGRLRPDAVVFCPTLNDVDSASNVLGNGSLTRDGVQDAAFGSRQSVVFRPRYVASVGYLSRWRARFREVGDSVERLRGLGVPVLVFFAATWEASFADFLRVEGDVRAPYLVTPGELTTEQWRNPAPWRHGTSAANREFGRLVYAALAPLLGWPARADAGSPRAAVRTIERLDEAAVQSAARELVERQTREQLAESYRPRPGERDACVGAMDCETGEFARATWLLVRRRDGARSVMVRVSAIPGETTLYPLEVSVTIPTAAGSSTRSATLAAGATVELALPLDAIPTDAAIDVIVTASGAAVAPKLVASRSARIAAVEQLD
jgi:hypothetical protein